MSGTKKSDVGSKVTADIVSKTIWVILAPVVTALVSMIGSFLQQSSIAIIISCVSLLISIVALVFFLRREGKSGVEQSKEGIVPQFNASTIEAEFYFVDRETMESRIEYDMKLTCSSMREYPRDLLWSGTEYNGTIIASEYAEEYEIEEQVGPQSPHDYLIKFKTEKKLGDTVKFKTITKVGDTGHIMKNYYAFTVTHQIGELVLRVSAPKGLIKDVKKAIYADRGRTLMVGTAGRISRKVVGNLEEYTFTYKNPTLLYNYFIEWQFTNP